MSAPHTSPNMFISIKVIYLFAFLHDAQWLTQFINMYKLLPYVQFYI